MTRDPIEAAFGELGEHYPGSRQKRRTVAKTPAPDPEDDGWDAHPVFVDLNGSPHEFFRIGALAMALQRKPVTMRKWIELGILPKERYRSQGSGVMGNGQRRLWTRLQIEGIVRIASEEGLFSGRPVGSTEFTSRVQELFRHLKAVEP